MIEIKLESIYYNQYELGRPAIHNEKEAISLNRLCSFGMTMQIFLSFQAKRGILKGYTSS